MKIESYENSKGKIIVIAEMAGGYLHNSIGYYKKELSRMEELYKKEQHDLWKEKINSLRDLVESLETEQEKRNSNSK